jgi:hypothetical protein
MMDDLRDYRFYKEDMLHPNSQAVNYIFEKFSKAYFSVETQKFVQDNLKIMQSILHRPQDKNNPKYLAFLQDLQQKIKEQEIMANRKLFFENSVVNP